jgi:general secretion pathway protein D
VLGNIPGFGFLFRSTSTTTEKQNLLVFLRPTVLGTRAAITSTTQKKFNDVFEIEIEGRDPADAISDLFDGNAP